MIGGQGKYHLFHVNGEVRPTFDGNRRTKTITGNREHKTTNLRWGGGGGGQGNTPLYFRGTWGPPPLLEVLANVSSAKHIKA